VWWSGVWWWFSFFWVELRLGAVRVDVPIWPTRVVDFSFSFVEFVPAWLLVFVVSLCLFWVYLLFNILFGWLFFWLMLICCERKILSHSWLILADKFKRTDS
jgi:hypothetical protein